MKILYYNWTPLEKKKEGGGVAVYMRNLLDYLQRSDLGLDVTFMSSGYYYDGGDRPYIRKEKDMYGASVFSIVNSPIIAPQGFPESALGLLPYLVQVLQCPFPSYIEALPSASRGGLRGAGRHAGQEHRRWQGDCQEVRPGRRQYGQDSA